MVAECPAGPEGVEVLRRAVSAVLSGGEAIALLPGYAPAPMREALLRDLRQAEPVGKGRLLCPTSGSTGASHWVVLPAEALHRAAVARDAHQGGSSAWLLGLPPATAAGVAAAARSVRTDSPLHCWHGVGGGRFEAEGFTADAAALLDRAEAAGVPARASVVATQLARLLDAAAATAADGPAAHDATEILRRFDAVLVGGGPLAPRLRERAMAAGVPVVATYGMTETAGGCVYDGRPTPGVDVTLLDGQVLLAADCLAERYLTAPLPKVGDAFATGDRGRWREERLEILGRLDDVVTVRGANVDLAAVRAVVADVVGVRESTVVAMPDPAGGARLRAVVVGEALPAQVRTLVAERLGAAAVPEVLVASALPRLPGGKVDLRRLAKGTE